MIISTINIILVTFLFVSLIINRNLYIQNRKYEKWVADSSTEFFRILDDARNKISECFDYIRELDQREMFEKDDDVGAIFVEISNVVEKLNGELKKYDETPEEEN